MNFDFKITIWERVEVKPENEKIVLQAIKDGIVNSADDIFNLLADKGDMNVNCKALGETYEQLTVKENKGSYTIEVIDNSGNTIFTNI